MTEIEQKAEKYATTGYKKNLLTKDQITILKSGRYDGYIAGATEASKVFEKQIEGLKDANRGLEDMYFMICKEKTEQNKELTEAKELLKTCVALLGMFNSSNGSVDNLIAKVEAFLKE